MAKYVIDANVVFTCLISGKEKYLALFNAHQIFLPDFAMEEIQKYQLVILKKTKVGFLDFQDYTLRLFDRIAVIPNLIISTSSYLEAFRWCHDVDENDMAYVALAIELGITLVTKDDELVTGLRHKGFPQVISFKEFIEKSA